MKTLALIATTLATIGIATANPEANATYQDIERTLGLVPTFLKAFPEEGIAAAWDELKTVQLNINIPEDAACFASGAAQNAGIVGAGGGGNSDCSNTQWDLSATTTDNANSGATVSVHQGIGMRVAIGTTC